MRPAAPSTRPIGFLILSAVLLLPASSTLARDEPTGQPSATPARSKAVQLAGQDLTGIDGKEGVVLSVEYPPGWSTPRHRHNAHVFVYVLEGAVVMQNDGAAPVTLLPGQTFYESPDDVHALARNASDTQPAKLLVFIVKDKGTPVTVPVQ